MLAVEEWRNQYLENVRHLALVELDWKTLGPRVDHWRELIFVDLERDPFLGDRDRFIQNLDGPENSLKSNSTQRRAFLMEHESLKTDNAE